MREALSLVLAQPTPHNIFTPIRRQFGEAQLYKLTECTKIPTDRQGLQELIDEIVDSVLKLPSREHYHLISTGHPLATYIAYETLRQRGDTVSILFFDGRTKSYLAARDLAKQVRESIKKKGGEKKQ